MKGVGEGWGDFVVSVEGSGSLLNVDGLSNLSQEPLVLPHQELGVIQCVVMTGG